MFISRAGGSNIKSILGWFNVKSYGAKGDNSTDDTAAIQTTIDACASAGGGVVYFPRGIYIVGGELQDVEGANAQIVLPSIADTAWLSMSFVGECLPAGAYQFHDVIVGNYSDARIKSTLGAGNGNVIGCIGPIHSGGLPQSFIGFHAENLTIQLPSNPTNTGVNLTNCAQVDLNNILIRTNTFNISSIVEPTTNTSYGLILPHTGNQVLARANNVLICGFYNGILFSEHSTGNNVRIFCCKRALCLDSYGYPVYLGRICVQWCANGIVSLATPNSLLIDEYVIERFTTIEDWKYTTYDVDDAGCHIHGKLNYFLNTPNPDFTKNRGDYLDCTNLVA
jgi:hypothetical protein